MPTYTLLGATGSTGSAIIRCLLSEPPTDLTLNLLLRSKAKLLGKIPEIESTDALKVKIVEGTPKDTTALQTCLANADVIFNCIGKNEPTAGTTLVYDTTTSIVSTINHHQQQGQSKKPTVIQLRSSSLNPQPALPWIARTMAHLFFYYVYVDLQRACDHLAASEHVLHYIYIDPPAIHDADGTTRTGHKLFTDATKDTQKAELSYSDLGAGFCEAASRREEFWGQGVFITATGKVNLTWAPLMGYMRQGLMSRIWG